MKRDPCPLPDGAEDFVGGANGLPDVEAVAYLYVQGTRLPADTERALRTPLDAPG